MTSFFRNVSSGWDRNASSLKVTIVPTETSNWIWTAKMAGDLVFQSSCEWFGSDDGFKSVYDYQGHQGHQGHNAELRGTRSSATIFRRDQCAAARPFQCAWSSGLQTAASATGQSRYHREAPRNTGCPGGNCIRKANQFRPPGLANWCDSVLAEARKSRGQPARYGRKIFPVALDATLAVWWLLFAIALGLGGALLFPLVSLIWIGYVYWIAAKVLPYLHSSRPPARGIMNTQTSWFRKAA